MEDTKNWLKHKKMSMALPILALLLMLSGVQTAAATNTTDFALLAQTNPLAAIAAMPSGTYVTQIGPTKFSEILSVSSLTSKHAATVTLIVTMLVNGTISSAATTVFSWSSISPDNVVIMSIALYPAASALIQTVSLKDLLTPSFTIFTDQIPDHTLASEMATAQGSDWTWSCGWFGCALSFNKGEGDLFSYLLDISGGGAGAIIGVLAYFAIVGALAATVVGIVLFLGTAYIASLDYFCGNAGYWIGTYWGGAFTGGCNPVPWYL